MTSLDVFFSSCGFRSGTKNQKSQINGYLCSDFSKNVSQSDAGVFKGTVF
jgi:hypothetical protein